MNASYILKSKNIFPSTSNINEPISGNVVIAGDKIVGVFSDDECGEYITAQTQILDYGDKLIIPGFIDSHTHTGMALDYQDDSFCVNLGSARNFPEIISLLKEFGEKYPQARVLYGYNYNFMQMEDSFIPDAAAIDAYIPDRPVMIQTWECHTYFANTAAIKAAGITKDTEDPNNGIGKDMAGELTGVFNDTAAFKLQVLLRRNFEDRKSALVKYMNKLNEYGITAVGDLYPCGDERPYPLYKAMEDKLTLRIHFYPELLSFKSEEIPEYRKNYSSPMLQFSGFKNLIDGVISVHTAWMSEPYYDDPSTCGFPAVSPQEVKAKVFEAASYGVNVRIHTIGDAAVHYVLDIFEEAKEKYGLLPRRNVMEHLEYVRDEDIPRFKELNIVAAMQGRHITFYVDDTRKYMGPEKERLAFRWRDIANTGAIIATGTDYPVIHFSPFPGLYAGITRKLENGYPEGGWLPEQCMTLAEMLKAYTINSAYCLNREDDLGSLEKGKYADITVLDKNLFDVSPEAILTTMPVMTMVNGKIVFQK